ncbi:MAG TPA: hypothetical protein PKC59_00780 [Burkholderiaceae bacterium]|nr:hypothetical protein [Burkholderiaceae bacterium]HMX09647.1 hypothetical protein [Burkholderiaceae bacterium]HMY98284.1 hypothetical protein [Burkholderiaceae bacterium]HNB42806.1 hypothetical protein [Burkholderiaceae bacterium]HNG78300.1 hypothetical protein [Burkholderiaceae bacterium]
MRYRLATEADFPVLLELLRHNPRHAFTPEVGERLTEVWSAWLAQDRHRPKPLVIWEDSQPDGHSLAQALGAGMFVPDAVYDDLRDTPADHPWPYLADRLLRRHLAGEPVILDTAAIARGNGGAGLNLVVTHYLQRQHDLTHPDCLRMLPLAPMAWYFCFAGNNLRRILGEVYGESAAAYVQAGGFRVLRRFPAAPGLPAESDPHLCELERSALPPAAFNAMSLWVIHPPAPQLGLAPSQQAVAQLALVGETDQRIAARLQISPDAVKQAWRGIVMAAASVIPELRDLGDSSVSHRVRGTERRRVVVEYLRQHLEELRPWPRVRRAGGPG